MDAAGRPHFGALLRQLRLDAGMTQQELAETANLSVEAVSALERGTRTRPHRDTVALLCRALALSPEREELLGNAIGIAPPQSRRGVSSSASLLRIVPSDAEGLPKHNLPQQLTSFVGRQQDVREIAALLGAQRLVTIVGAGGVGKTRVSVHTASSLLGDCPDGAWLVDLAPLTDESLLPGAVLTALQLQLPSTSGSALDAVLAFLKRRRLLLILDNCEHVIDRARDVAANIAHTCPYVRILSTSREALNVPGEHVYRLPSLTVPSESCQTVPEASAYGAVALFVDRALAADASFALDDDNVAAVCEICRRLDGIPLAIELAAARVTVLGPRHIAQRLDRRFRLLTGGERGALPRHQTMSALLDWSYDLLSDRERWFFESLSVFAGGCTLEAATEVCKIDAEDDLDIVELITSLVSKSLLVAEIAGDCERYRFLESSRQYARDKLIARGVQEETARRHARFYVELAERLEVAYDTTPDREWLPPVCAELEDWRAALEWALAKRNDVVLGQRLASLGSVLTRSFPSPEARHWVHAALELVDDRSPTALTARLELAHARLAGQIGEQRDSLPAAERALQRYRELGDVRGIAQAQCMVAKSLVSLERPAEAEPLLDETLATARAVGDRRLTASVLATMGRAKSRLADFAGARAYYTEALGIAKTAGADYLAASIMVVLADNEADAGDLETAIGLTTDMIATLRSLGYSRAPMLAIAVGDLAEYLIVLGRYDDARPHAHETLELAREMKYVPGVAMALRVLAIAVLLRPQTERERLRAQCGGAAQLLGFAAARLNELGFPEVYTLPLECNRALTVLRDVIGADELARHMATGATLTEDAAIDLTHALE